MFVFMESSLFCGLRPITGEKAAVGKAAAHGAEHGIFLRIKNLPPDMIAAWLTAEETLFKRKEAVLAGADAAA